MVVVAVFAVVVVDVILRRAAKTVGAGLFASLANCAFSPRGPGGSCRRESSP